MYPFCGCDETPSDSFIDTCVVRVARKHKVKAFPGVLLFFKARCYIHHWRNVYVVFSLASGAITIPTPARSVCRTNDDLKAFPIFLF